MLNEEWMLHIILLLMLWYEIANYLILNGCCILISMLTLNAMKWMLHIISKLNAEEWILHVV
jgi:hypothetical protein